MSGHGFHVHGPHDHEIEHAAQMARLELLRLYGQQEGAFTYTLPLCRGLR